MDGVKLDITDLKRNTGKKERKIDLDDLRYNEMVEAEIERFKNKDKLTMQDIMSMQTLMDMQEERRMRKNQYAQPQIDVEEIIRKATEPLNEQIKEMKRQQEKAEEERKWDNMQKQIDKLADMMMSMGKKSDDDNPMMKQMMEQFKALQDELRDEKEKARRKEEDDFKKSLQDMVYGLSDQINDLKSKPEKSQSEVEQIISLEKKKREILDALGVKPEKGKEDDASFLDLTDSMMDRVPKMAKTISTVKEMFSKDSEIPDDVPEDVPTNLPQRNEPIPQRSTIPDDIKEFLDRGRVENGTYIDYTGTPWVNLEGNPISRKDIEDLALTNPEDVRRLMKDTDNAFRKKNENKPPVKSEDVKISKAEPVSTDEEEEEDDISEPETEKGNARDEAIKEAMDYIATGKDMDNENGKVWVGAKNEFYTNDDGKPATEEDLKRMAQEDPETFMHDVKEHLKSIGE